jgi:TetR/AcrR family transcriptional regulator, regulator of cefoperazone and chloramphenicol sensitivity
MTSASEMRKSGQRHMAKTVPAKRKMAKVRAAANGGYQKGEETRERILNAALTEFGEASFLAATTRRIAEAARVSLPTLQYYFGSKEGLYLACAETIVAQYRRNTTAASEAADALRKGCAAETARAHLKAVIGALAGFLVGSQKATQWTHFVARELRDPGPAFEILYANLWRPGVEITARLIACILGKPENDPAPRIQALLLISSLLVFQSGRSMSMRAMQWATIGHEELALVLSGLKTQIDAIGSIST